MVGLKYEFCPSRGWIQLEELVVQYVSILDFIRTGELGGIKLGMNPLEVEELFGDPLYHDGETDVRFWFKDNKLVCIYTGYTDGPNDTGIPSLGSGYFSTKMAMDWKCIKTNLDEHYLFEMEQLNLVKGQCFSDAYPNDWEDDYFGIIVYDSHYYGYEMLFRSGVTIDTHFKQYSSISVRIGEVPKDTLYWQFKKYWGEE
jgi:hypothetical protein